MKSNEILSNITFGFKPLNKGIDIEYDDIQISNTSLTFILLVTFILTLISPVTTIGLLFLVGIIIA